MKHLKLFFALFAMLALGVSNAWGAEKTITLTYSDFGLTNSYAQKTATVDGIGFTVNQGYKGSGNVIQMNSSKGAGVLYNTTSIAGLKSITVNVSSGSKTYTITSGTAQTPSGNSQTGTATKTFSIPSGDTYFQLKVSGASYFSSIVITYDDSNSGGETPEPDPTPGTSANVTYDFTKIDGFSSWGNSYSSYEVTYSDAKVTFEAASKQTGTITDCPVTKGKSVVLVMTDGSKLSSVKWVCKQWTTKTQTITLHYSTNGGGTYTTTGITSTNFSISSDNLPAGTNAVKITFSSTSNQVGISSCTITKVSSGSTEPTPSVTLDPSEKDFGTVNVGDKPSQEFTITTENTTAELTASIDNTTDYAVSAIAGNQVTVTYQPKSAGTHSAVLTVKAGEEATATVNLTGKAVQALEGTWALVTDASSLKAGDEIIIAAKDYDVALGTTQANNNRPEVAIEKNGNTITATSEAQVLTLQAGNQANTLALYTGSGYLYAASSGNNYLRTETTLSDNSSWDISIADGTATLTAQGEFTRNTMFYNLSSKIFACYASTTTNQKAIALYKKASEQTVTIATCENGSVSASVANGAKVLSGTTITLNNTPATGYKLAAYDVYKTDDANTKVTVTDGKFIMPEFDVTISATFELAKTLTSIEITTSATQTTFWQGETFNYTGLKVTAHFDGAADEVVTPTVTGSTATAGTQTVTVSFTEGTVTKSTSYEITVKAIPNTKETAYTVADAYNIIDKLTTAEGVFISGIISQVDSYNNTYKSITYWISADGTTTKQLQVYSGKGLEGADFAAVTDLSVGDQVIVCGNLKKFNETYEFDKNNYLASHTPTTKDPAGLAYATTSYTANVGEAFTTPELTNPHNLVVTYSTSDASKATVDVNTGAVTIVAAGEVTITASTTGDATHDAGSASYTITITDLSLLIATLPFEFNGKQADIEGTAGMTHSGIDADDYKSAPYLKMNTTGDWLIICFDSEPEKLSYDIKNNSFSGGTFSVQESADGETYTDVKVHTEITETQNEEHTLLSTSRYVKFIYTEKVNGNVGLGNIKITKPDNRADAGLAWNPATVSLTVGDAFTAPTFNNPNGLSGITFASSNEELATVNNAGEITLVSGKTGTATITATFADGHADYKPATATCTITVNEYIETIDGEWELVTDASKLQAGMEIIIASVADAGAVKTMGEQGNNNRSAVASTVGGDKLNPAVGTTVITLEDCQLYEGLFALKTKDGYLYAAGSSSNHLKSQEGINEDACWTIIVTEGVASVVATNSSNRNIMRYNETSDLFSCYASGQQDIALYAKKPAECRSTSAGRYGTVCLPGNIVKCLGATLYEVAGREGDKVIFDEVITPEAGMPYIFLAHNAEVLFYCGDQTAAAGNHKSLYGTFTVMQDAQLDGMYMVQNNKIVKCAATGCGVAAYRAYFNGGELDALESAPAPMPGRRRITMGTEGENEATGTEDVVAPEGQTLKLIENGQLIIIRNGEKFNAQGVRL